MADTATLAKGCFGKVYKEKYNDKWAAIKRVPTILISSKDLDRECEVYKKSAHPNIVKLLGPVTLKNGKYEIPMEFIFGEDLETTIFKVRKSKVPFTFAAKSTIIQGMCEGLLHLHLLDIVHQDLKPDNIMVEHKTNRAVIIDLGLAKFFKNGLNSATDLGNEAYAAPEVLKRGSQRDQRSDVWAMGKIIAELCARVRLATPGVNPEKIKDTLKDSPYCHAVCQMVHSDPSRRATMAEVISAIRVAGPATPTPAGTGRANHLAPPANPVNARNRSPSPMNRAGSHFDRTPSPFNRDPAPAKPTPARMEGVHHLAQPGNPVNPGNGSPSPINQARGHSPFPRKGEGIPKPEVKPANPSPTPLIWERNPRSDPKRPTPKAHLSPSPPKNQVPEGGPAEITSGLILTMLYQEAEKDLPRRPVTREGQLGMLPRVSGP